MLWNKDEEYKFFKKTLEIATPEQLFYLTEDGKYLAYWPKGYEGRKTTLQSRNAFIGSYTEKWVKELLTPIAKEFDAYAKLRCQFRITWEKNMIKIFPLQNIGNS